MGDDKVGVDLVQSVDEGFEHLLLVIVNSHCRSILLIILLGVVWERNGVKLAHHSKRLEFLFFCWAVLIDFILYDARDHCNFSCVLLTPRHFTRKSKADEGR